MRKSSGSLACRKIFSAKGRKRHRGRHKGLEFRGASNMGVNRNMFRGTLYHVSSRRNETILPLMIQTFRSESKQVCKPARSGFNALRRLLGLGFNFDSDSPGFSEIMMFRTWHDSTGQACRCEHYGYNPTTTLSTPSPSPCMAKNKSVSLVPHGQHLHVSLQRQARLA